MEKVFEFNLNVERGEPFPQMPVLHDCVIDEIFTRDGTLYITSADVANHDYDYSDVVGFCAEKVQIEFIFDESAECEVLVSKFFPKKQIKEKNKYGYGKRSNCYDIAEFTEIYKDYNLEMLYNMVCYNQVNIYLAAHKKRMHEAEMHIFCSKVRYVFLN